MKKRIAALGDLFLLTVFARLVMFLVIKIEAVLAMISLSESIKFFQVLIASSLRFSAASASPLSCKAARSPGKKSRIVLVRSREACGWLSRTSRVCLKTRCLTSV